MPSNSGTEREEGDMFWVERNVGKLIEISFETPLTNDEVTEFRHKSIEVLHRTPSYRVVLVVNMMRARVFSDPVIERLLVFAREKDARVERAAFLLNESSVQSMQIERSIRVMGGDRRAYKDAAALKVWLGERLDVEERLQLAKFLSKAAG